MTGAGLATKLLHAIITEIEFIPTSGSISKSGLGPTTKPNISEWGSK